MPDDAIQPNELRRRRGTVARRPGRRPNGLSGHELADLLAEPPGPSGCGKQDSRFRLEHSFATCRSGDWHDPDLGRPIAAPLEQCAELLGVDLAIIREAAANLEPYLRADGTSIWSLTQLQRQLRPEAYRRRRGGYLDRRRTLATDA
jgi:hypothetical protein